MNEAAADSLRLFIDTVRILTDDDVVKLNALSDAASRLTKFKDIEMPQIDSSVSDNISTAGTAARDSVTFVKWLDHALMNLAGGSAKAAAQSIKLVFSPLTMAASKFQKAAVKAGQFLSSIKRIAMYRAIRSAIKAITEGFEEGRKNLYYYSQAVGTDFAPSMDKAATAAMYLKNSIGAATAPLTNYLVPMIDAAVDHIVELINKQGHIVGTVVGGIAVGIGIYAEYREVACVARPHPVVGLSTELTDRVRRCTHKTYVGIFLVIYKVELVALEIWQQLWIHMLLAFNIIGVEQLLTDLCKLLTVERLLFGHLAAVHTLVDLVSNILYVYNECEGNVFARQLLFVTLAPETIVQVVVLYSAQLLYETETAVVVCQYEPVW